MGRPHTLLHETFAFVYTSGVPTGCANNVVRCYIRRFTRMLNLFESNNMKEDLFYPFKNIILDKLSIRISLLLFFFFLRISKLESFNLLMTFTN